MNKHLRNFMNLKKKPMLKAISVAALAAIAFTGCGQNGGQTLEKEKTYQPGEKLKLGFAYIGSVGDAGWSFTHDEARRAIEKKFGDKIETSFVELADPSDDGHRVLKSLADNGNHMIFGTTFGYAPSIKALSEQYPNIKWEHANGSYVSKNISVYDVKTFEGAYLSGIIAGATTNNNNLGYIGSVAIPKVYRNINAFTIGAQSINPNITVNVAWVGSWIDEPKEREAALQLLNKGVDVIFQNTDSTIPLVLAEERGFRAFGWASDMSGYAPTAHLASAIINWAPYYEERIQAMLDGKWEAKNTLGGVKEGVVDVVSLSGDIPRSGVRAFSEAKKKMQEEDFNMWVGPLKKNTGEDFLAAGVVATEEQLNSMNFFVEGVAKDAPLK